MTTTTTTKTSPARRTPPVSHGLIQPIAALLWRDVRVLRRGFRQFVIRTIMQPLLFCFVFSYVFPKIGQGIGAGGGSGPNFATLLVPGLIAVAIIFQGVQSVAIPLTQEFGYTKEIEDRVLAPLPIWAVGVGKIIAGALQAVVAAAVVFPIVYFVHAKGQAPTVHISNWPLFIVVLLLASVLSASFGLLIGTSFKPQQVPLIFSILVLPMTLLGCIYYPWAKLAPIGWLKFAVLINPLVYMSEGMRASLTPDVPHMNVAVILLVMLAVTGAFALASLRKFRDRVVG
ncbi:MAG: ABC transporter permease [Pseudonocardiales bacterium]